MKPDRQAFFKAVKENDDVSLSAIIIIIIIAIIIGGFHVTQVSLIITQLKNKIAYHSINRVKHLKYRRRVINKPRANISGMCDILNSSCKRHHWKVQSFVWRRHVGARLRDSNMAAGNQWKHLEFRSGSLKTFILSVNNNTNNIILYNELLIRFCYHSLQTEWDSTKSYYQYLAWLVSCNFYELK